jgi:hypothetical protein
VAAQAFGRAGEFVMQLRQVAAADVAEVNPLEVAPDALACPLPAARSYGQRRQRLVTGVAPYLP